LEAERPVDCELDLVVSSFESGVGDSVLEEVEDSLEVTADGLGEAAQRLPARQQGGSRPSRQETPGLVDIHAIPEVFEVDPKLVRSGELRVDRLDLLDGDVVLRRPVLRVA